MKMIELKLPVRLFEKGDRIKTDQGLATVLKDEVEPIKIEDAVNGELLVRYDNLASNWNFTHDSALIKKNKVKVL